MSINPKDILNKNKNSNKRVNINEINLNDISIDDLKFGGDNYKNYIHLISLLEEVSSCQISDAFFSIAKKSPAIQSIKPINNQKVWGTIFTSQTKSDDWGTSALAIDKASRDDILFFKVDSEDKAIWGELASRSAQSKGIKATAIYGSVRDMEALLYMDYPVFASNFCPNAGSALGLGTFGKSFEIEGVNIDLGDFLFGDENGIVVIPKKLFKDTMIATLSIKIKEEKIINNLKGGLNLAEVAGLKKK